MCIRVSRLRTWADASWVWVRVRGRVERMRSHHSTLHPPVTITWEERDRYRGLTRLALAAVFGAFLLAWRGLPPLDIHSPLHFVGIMDPLCGMTRAARALALGDLVTAWIYNPGIFPLAILAGGVLLRAALGTLRWRWLAVTIRWRRLGLATVAVAVVALWIRQQLHAELLIEFGMRLPG